MRASLKAFSFFLVGALALVALLAPTTVEAQELDPGVVTIDVVSSDPSIASVMPAGSTWMVSDGVNTISDTFAEGDLALPASIVTDTAIPGGTYTVTINAGPTFALFSDAYVVDGDTALTITLTPIPPAPDPEPEPVMAPVNASAWECTGLDAPGLLTDVGDDCVPTTATFDFYLVGDGSGIPNYSLAVDGSGSTSVEVGDYEVWATDGTMFNLTVTEAGATFAYGYPAAPAPEPEPEMATLNVSTYACDGIEGDPIVLGEVGPDCTPISTTLSFYLWGDGTDDFWQVTTSTTGAVALDLPEGGYDVVNEATQGTVGVEVPAGTSAVAFGFATGGPAPDPDPETATLSVTTWACDGIEGDPIVLGEIGPDCTQVSTTLSFYLWGDGTDDYWPLTTSATDAAVIELPVGGYDVVNEVTQETVGVQVPAGSSSVALGFATGDVVEPEMATLAVTAYACDGIEGEPIVLEEIGPDCVQISTTLSFYLWGDGTDDFWQVTTSSTDPVAIDLPVGGYQVVNEATQQTVGVQVPSGTSEVAFGFPTSVPPADDAPPADQPPAQQPPAAQAPVSKLPSTGVGTDNSVNALAVIASGVILAAGALGLRVRYSNIWSGHPD